MGRTKATSDDQGSASIEDPTIYDGNSRPGWICASPQDTIVAAPEDRCAWSVDHYNLAHYRDLLNSDNGGGGLDRLLEELSEIHSSVQTACMSDPQTAGSVHSKLHAIIGALGSLPTDECLTSDERWKLEMATMQWCDRFHQSMPGRVKGADQPSQAQLISELGESIEGARKHLGYMGDGGESQTSAKRNKKRGEKGAERSNKLGER